ncbi:serine/threonine protein kinase, partial [Emiliania huxleyi CCMP1516]|uniref:non-specific serine/threonine protein kinase n=3 Tax=Emiliania huxleyi TaxID=2903 RepID=A0A0D3K6Q6_EMIH1
LGSGSSGKVWRVRRRSNGDALALKEICGFDDQQELTQRTVLSEVRLLASIRHDNVVGYLESFIEAGSLHIVMELCDGGDL